MAPCNRCGAGTRHGRGRGWCSNETCRKEEQAEKQAAKRAHQEGRAAKGAGQRGPCPTNASAEPRRKARKEAHQKEGAGAESACPDEEGREENAAPQAPKQARKEELQDKGVDERDPSLIGAWEPKAEKTREAHGPPFFDDGSSSAAHLKISPSRMCNGQWHAEAEKKAACSVGVYVCCVCVCVCWPCDIDSHAIFALNLTWITRACVVSCTYIHVYIYIYTRLCCGLAPSWLRLSAASASFCPPTPSEAEAGSTWSCAMRARDVTEAEGHASAFITAVLLGIAFPRHVYLKARLDEAMFHFGCLVGLLAPLSCLATAFSQDGQECYSHVAALP